RASDRVREIEWAASARSCAQGAGLLVREWDPPGYRPRRVTVLFHSFGSESTLIRPDRFERAIRLVWGAVGELLAAGLEVRWLADFDAWVPRTISTRRELGRLGARLAACRRQPATERHELEARLEACEGEVWIFSDMPVVSWAEVMEAFPQYRVVDVARFELGRRLNIEGRGGA
ncbi:MAG: hypothetical protein ACQKBU_02815, partial [Verrucomicrobiales bacterium]